MKERNFEGRYVYQVWVQLEVWTGSFVRCAGTTGFGRLGGSSWGEGSTQGLFLGNEQHGGGPYFVCHIFTQHVKY